MPDMKFDEPMVTIVNPCPKMTVEDLCRLEDDLPKIDPNPGDEKRQAFMVEFQWSTGGEQDRLILNPGESRPCPAPLARQMKKDVGHRGLVILDEAAQDDEVERMRQIARGLREAMTYYSEEGTVRLAKRRRAQGLGEDEMKQLVHQHRSYYLNQRRYRLLDEFVKKINSTLDKARKESSKAA